MQHKLFIRIHQSITDAKPSTMGVKRSRAEHRRQQARRFFEGCCNSMNLEQLSMKERMAVAAELDYHTVIISKFYGMEALTKKDRCGILS